MPIPHEPAIFEAAKHHTPSLVATVAVLGSATSSLLDYWLLGSGFNHRLVQPRLRGSRQFDWIWRHFSRAPFVIVVFAGAVFPFHVVKIVSIAGGYPLRRYFVANLIGRWPRFYLLAWFGGAVRIPGSMLAAVAVALALLSFVPVGLGRGPR